MGKEISLPGMEEFTKKPTKKGKTKTQMQIQNKQYVNPTTGELENFTVIKKNVNADFNFHKIWLEDLLNILNTIGNKKITILSYLLKIMRSSDNSLNFTIRSLSEDTGVSSPTCQTTIHELMESNVIKRDERIKQLYTFNPDLLVKGNSDKRRKLLVEYNFDDETKDNKNAIKNLAELLPIENRQGEKVINVDPNIPTERETEYTESKDENRK